MTYMEIQRLSTYWKSVLWELVTGYDSIRTIRDVYSRGDDFGAYQCVFPDCKYARFDMEDLWHHVHFSRKHDPQGKRAAELDRFNRFLYERTAPLTTFR